MQYLFTMPYYVACFIINKAIIYYNRICENYRKATKRKHRNIF